MAIQIEQRFPRCQRCGRMIHLRAQRIETISRDGARVSLCSAICRDEYQKLFGLSEAGEWRLGSTSGVRRT